MTKIEVYGNEFAHISDISSTSEVIKWNRFRPFVGVGSLLGVVGVIVGGCIHACYKGQTPPGETRKGNIRDCRDLCVYTPWSLVHKNVSLYFYYNFGKCGSILIILSFLCSQINCERNWTKTHHLTSNLLPHCLAKCECLTVTLFV